jgi:hypothetical protein
MFWSPRGETNDVFPQFPIKRQEAVKILFTWLTRSAKLLAFFRIILAHKNTLYNPPVERGNITIMTGKLGMNLVSHQIGDAPALVLPFPTKQNGKFLVGV